MTKEKKDEIYLLIDYLEDMYSEKQIQLEKLRSVVEILESLVKE